MVRISDTDQRKIPLKETLRKKERKKTPIFPKPLPPPLPTLAAALILERSEAMTIADIVDIISLVILTLLLVDLIVLWVILRRR